MRLVACPGHEPLHFFHFRRSRLATRTLANHFGFGVPGLRQRKGSDVSGVPAFSSRLK